MKIYETPPNAWEQIYLRHETIYTYSQPVKFSEHRLVVRPKEGHDVRLNEMNLTTFPQSDVFWYRDMLDNNIAVANFAEMAAELRIISEFSVSVPQSKAKTSPIFLPYPSLVAGIEQMVAVPYLQYIYPPEVATLRQWFEGSGLAPKPGQKAAIFDDMAILIHRVIKYTRREESGVQSPAETLRLSSGSCRDMAVLMIETSRALGYPARFVSGYMESESSLVGRGSTHAWAEVYLPELGWTGFDPSIGAQVGPGHIAVGVSHHPRGVMPITGGFTGPPSLGKSMKVAITTKRLAPVEHDDGTSIQSQSQSQSQT